MLNLNRAMVIGNTTRDPEMRYTPNGRAVTSFAVATNRRWTNQSGETQEDVQYHEVVAWGKLAEIASQILQKGKKVYVEGRLQTRNWEGQDGVRRNRTEIVAENIIALSPREETGAVPSPPVAEPETPVESKGEVQIEPEVKPVSEEVAEGTPLPKSPESDEEEIKLDDIPF